MKIFCFSASSGPGGGGSGLHHSGDDCQEDCVMIPGLIHLFSGKYCPSSIAASSYKPTLVLDMDSFSTEAQYFFLSFFSELSLEALDFLACWRSCRVVLAPHPTRVPALQTHFSSFSVYISFSDCFTAAMLPLLTPPSSFSKASDSGGETDCVTCSLYFVLFILGVLFPISLS